MVVRRHDRNVKRPAAVCVFVICGYRFSCFGERSFGRSADSGCPVLAFSDAFCEALCCSGFAPSPSFFLGCGSLFGCGDCELIIQTISTIRARLVGAALNPTSGDLHQRLRHLPVNLPGGGCGFWASRRLHVQNAGVPRPDRLCTRSRACDALCPFSPARILRAAPAQTRFETGSPPRPKRRRR